MGDAMIQFLGYLNASILVILSLRWPYFIWFKRSKKSKESKLLAKTIRRLHPILGGVLVMTGILHGYLAWGWNFRRTGYLLYFFVLLQGILGLGLLKKRKGLKNPHRWVSLMALVLLGLHVFYRTALG
ncbi:hypothetical protein SANA_04060 [Gottschalkiaceae bacterium SANA]|nr:hypothetical protein SANA_04060 [Gottschalkiaceae bacterium SANA]